MAQLQQSSIRNRLLASLSCDDFALVQPHLEAVTLGVREHLFRAEQKITHVTFPEYGIASIVADTEEGRFEVGMVGSEGLVGTAVVLGVDRTPHTCMVQAAGEAFRIGADELQAAMDHSATLRALLLRFVHTFIVQVSQTAYANAGYSIEDRLARWLLMTHDRLEKDDMPVTHEFLSVMLGTRRPGVTLAVQMLEGTGVIRATRGHVTVRDREKLEQIAGQAYGFAEKEYSNVFQFPIKRDR
ncbi:Crp/Fnr family transcriptional regulator (plasmid) [Mesorhizobium loti]|uniref:Crp/Fnr family transcriptional regulator n=1 Tax=Mesorhizobium jarvisii TaxID=1777867 RepID=A0A6M7TUQ5_9HYPH|nr:MULTISPECIES: Crp/Fnr family transcriptional regulator [Mesorhizobium]ANN62230.1 CarD family transcriptional regulator [Mesorhizobium loti NZP2037]OBQ71144.1 CarD family transcriptional regulator [Mesorhizobium loti]QKC67603.1 Crp/Fnr family transcriptional regulator [Mesorhizobium jarvisii]QKD13516.1 Crp/Fnr family transcriptional regulator [Mesorhizobium loti]RJT29379.1 Crp/Fnr family transcriptional regulator [Mesorhizobium jarvisii]